MKTNDKNESKQGCCDDLAGSLSPEFFKALADPNRVALLVFLAESGKEQTVSEMSCCCPIDLSVVSRHLGVLKNAGILEAQKRGREVYYRVQVDKLTTLLRNLADALEACCPEGYCTPRREEMPLNKNKMPEDPESIRKTVSERYAQVAQRSQSCCGPSTSSCSPETETDQIATRIGYSSEQLKVLPGEANLGLGCGNPTAIDSLKPGEVVVDLGSGAGIDVFLAAKEVGPTGKVIGVDMTDAMLEKARNNARKGGYENVEFRKGRIEDLPVEDESVDVIISNCVINLSPEKDKVFREAYRVLKPGGRMMISDIVLEKELPQEVADRIEAYVACVGGASLRSEYLQTVQDAGFSEIRVDGEGKLKYAIAPDEPSTQKLASEYGIPSDKVSEVMDSVTSLNLYVRK